MIPYHFSLLRYVHNAASEEFVNIGVALWLPRERRLLFAVNDRYSRLSRFFQEFDGSGFRQLVRGVTARLDEKARQLVAAQPPASFADLLGSVVPDDASCFRWSSTMGGVVTDPERRLRELMAEFIERHEAAGPRTRRDETSMWTSVETLLEQRGLLPRLRVGVELQGGNYAYRFRVGWRNGVDQVLEPISLDYLHAADVVEKATTWSGRLFNLAKDKQFGLTGVVAKPDRRDLIEPYEQAVAILKGAPNVRAVVEESALPEFLPEIERDLRAEH